MSFNYYYFRNNYKQKYKYCHHEFQDELKMKDLIKSLKKDKIKPKQN